MKSLGDVFRIIDEYTLYLEDREFQFSAEGLPIFTKEMFLHDTPELLVPVQHRKNRRVKNPDKTVLVFFCDDTLIYRRLDKLLDEIDMYKDYMGIVQADVTVTADMDIEWQRAIMLLNQLVMAMFAVNGIKVVLNSRRGCKETMDMFRYMPKGICIASGYRGASQSSKMDFSYLAKMLWFMPEKIYIYGAVDDSLCEQMLNMGLDYIIYPDFRSYCNEVA
ncbi:MAG: DUF4417 domain-containing protein [Pseudobutyrivibrio sp.]|nr:DUF4417 domain-containing protein [Pseudobutyrivibrio sp.]